MQCSQLWGGGANRGLLDLGDFDNKRNKEERRKRTIFRFIRSCKLSLKKVVQSPIKLRSGG